DLRDRLGRPARRRPRLDPALAQDHAGALAGPVRPGAGDVADARGRRLLRDGRGGTQGQPPARSNPDSAAAVEQVAQVGADQLPPPARERADTRLGLAAAGGADDLLEL